MSAYMGPLKARSWMNWRLLCPHWNRERWIPQRLPRFARERLT